MRAYWFVIEDIDCFPFGLDKLLMPENETKLRAILSRHTPFREQLQGLQGDLLRAQLHKIVERLKRTQQRVESRFSSWHAVQNGIAIKHRAIEFRRAGGISYSLIDERFGAEKAVDVRLACDMIMLRDIYDTAVIVSGDQDYVPAAQILKDAGKTVVNVAFEEPDGKLLPGGARRLNIVTDASVSVPYARLREFMGLDAEVVTAFAS